MTFPWTDVCATSETDADYATRLISLDDDPTLRIYTFRMWFLALGLSCFAAVLGQIFVSDLHRVFQKGSMTWPAS
jgi:hypothetical protein